MEFFVIWRLGQPHANSGKGCTIHKVWKERDSSICVNAPWLAGLLDSCQEYNDWSWGFSVERLVLHLYWDFLAHVLSLGRNMVIVPLQIIEETAQRVVNGLLVPLFDWYRNFEARLRTISLALQGYWWAIAWAATSEPSHSFSATTIITADTRLNPIRRGTVQSQIVSNREI